MKREVIHKLIEIVPEDKLPELEKYIRQLAHPQDEPTKAEIKAIETAREEYRNGETHSYTVDELYKEFLGHE